MGIAARSLPVNLMRVEKMLSLSEEIERLYRDQGKYARIFPGYITHIRFPRLIIYPKRDKINLIIMIE